MNCFGPKLNFFIENFQLRQNQKNKIFTNFIIVFQYQLGGCNELAGPIAAACVNRFFGTCKPANIAGLYVPKKRFF